MRRTPAVVLAAGIIAAAAGALLLCLSGRVDGVRWLGLCVTIGGIVLIGMWMRSRQPEGSEPVDGVASVRPPGRWYPWALGTIIVLLVVWIEVWSKLW